jgi:hypothetical protein
MTELEDPDFEKLILDSTVIRAHQHAAGKNGGQEVLLSIVLAVDSVPRFTPQSMAKENQPSSFSSVDKNLTSSKRPHSSRAKSASS